MNQISGMEDFMSPCQNLNCRKDISKLSALQHFEDYLASGNEWDLYRALSFAGDVMDEPEKSKKIINILELKPCP